MSWIKQRIKRIPILGPILQRSNHALKSILNFSVLLSAHDTLVVDAKQHLSAEVNAAPDNNDLFSIAFNNAFVDSEIVLDKVKQYLPYVLKAHQKAKSGKYFLDIGCGRGEFLGLLKDSGVPVKGLDINNEACKTLKTTGMDVECSDAIEFLRAIEDNTLIGLSAVQVIEHLPEDYIKELCALAYRKIAPNGLLLLETINPQCSFALGQFYMDPTHLRPYHPDFMAFLLEWYGFKDIKKFYSALCPVEFRTRYAAEHNYFAYAAVGWRKDALENH